jgi:hypothetical protein
MVERLNSRTNKAFNHSTILQTINSIRYKPTADLQAIFFPVAALKPAET